MDLAHYPGDAIMQSLWDHTNLAWTGLYLPVAGPGYQSKLSWRRTYGRLRAMGWGVAPLYVGKQHNSQTLRSIPGGERFNGYRDGLEACGMAAAEGIPRPSVIYFDYEGLPVTNAWSQYFAGWVEAVNDQHYCPGLYTSYFWVRDVLGGLNVVFQGRLVHVELWGVDWWFKQNEAFNYPIREFFQNDPTESKLPSATSWQITGNSWISWEHPLPGGKKQVRRLQVDLDTSIYLDPGLRTRE
jgi:hypothetical protein